LNYKHIKISGTAPITTIHLVGLPVFGKIFTITRSVSQGIKNHKAEPKTPNETSGAATPNKLNMDKGNKAIGASKKVNGQSLGTSLGVGPQQHTEKTSKDF